MLMVYAYKNTVINEKGPEREKAFNLFHTIRASVACCIRVARCELQEEYTERVITA